MWIQYLAFFVSKPSNSYRWGIIKRINRINPTTTGGVNVTHTPINPLHTRETRKMKKEDSKIALPNPPHPANTQRFIVYMRLPSTKLVECNKSVKTCSVVIYSSYNEKTSKKPSGGRATTHSNEMNLPWHA